jgi:CubicO group peptidase (beta-lactamase class C family)
MLGLREAEAEHGAQFNYRSIETDVVAHAMERVTGQRLAQIISERLWAPLGCEEDANITVDSAGYGLSCGGISASLRDMARFGIALLNDGMVEGRQVIPRAFIEDTRHGAHGLFDDENRITLPDGTYRNQFWVEDSRSGRFMCRGVFGQLVYVAPDAGLVAVKLSTYPEFLNRGFFLQTLAAFHALARL